MKPAPPVTRTFAMGLLYIIGFGSKVP
jgi:hypothetical protein